MSSTSDTARDERMLPGVSAFTWSRIGLITYPVGFVLLLVMAALTFLKLGTWPLLWTLVGPILALFACAGVAIMGVTLRRRSETEAGYTTLPDVSPNLDQLDYRSGIVLRRAGEPVLRPSGTLGFLRGRVGAPSPAPVASETAFPARTPAKIVASIAPAAIVVVFIVGFGLIRGFRADAIVHFGLFVGVGVGVLGVLYLLFVAYTRATLVRRIRRIADGRPASMIFTSGMTVDLLQGMDRLGVTPASSSGRFPVAVTEPALELWSNESPPVMRIAVPWNEIRSIEPISVAVSRNSFKGVEVQLTHEDVAVRLPLAIYGRQGMASASSEWANQVFDEIRHHLAARPESRS